MRTYIKIAFGTHFNVGPVKRGHGHRADHLVKMALTARQPKEIGDFFLSLFWELMEYGCLELRSKVRAKRMAVGHGSWKMGARL